MTTKKTYLRLFSTNGKLSAKINAYTGKTLRALADEADKAFESAQKDSYTGDKVRAGFISLNEMHPERIKEWELPEGTQQLSIVTTAEIEERKNRTGL